MSAISDLLLEPLSYPLDSTMERQYIGGSMDGTAKTIQEMQKLVTSGKRDMDVRALAGSLIQNCAKKDYYNYAKNCFEFCRDQIQYAFDPNNVELIERPGVVLRTKVADCDSICVLLASLLENLGFPCRYATIKADSSRPDEYSHIYMEVKVPKHGWIPADATMNHEFGWEPDKKYIRTYWPASLDDPEGHDFDYNHVSCLSGYCGDFVDEVGTLPVSDSDVDLTDLRVVPGMAGLWDDIFGTSSDSSGVDTSNVSQSDISTADSGVVQIISDIIDGNYSSELLSMREVQRNRVGDLYSALIKAENNGDSSAQKQIQAAQAVNSKALTSTNEAVNKYNDIVSAIQTYSFGEYKPALLSGMGLAPIAIAAIAVAGGITIASMCYAFSDLINAARGNENAAQAKMGTIQSIGYTMESAGNLTSSLTIAAVVAAVGYFGYMFMKKRKAATGAA